MAFTCWARNLTADELMARPARSYCSPTSGVGSERAVSLRQRDHDAQDRFGGRALGQGGLGPRVNELPIRQVRAPRRPEHIPFGLLPPWDDDPVAPRPKLERRLAPRVGRLLGEQMGGAVRGR